ncbi:hypothetical protein UMM65_07760 [Aureibaculum sp. 2210JD6-5]|uniref:YncE family protein n=1 Tax=Aureibaculum sp. 2210JD6-5 TaxID=3103957 RepID=UPI002AACB74F|nr:DUF5074 domain-containing protein [Aureibaculum sp. 2210JD6-5]MDY7395134.1 hypothetical protein [Aureibaculum sp. 2210JD6-5]
MNKKFLKISVLFLAILFSFTSCDNSDDPKPIPKGDFDNGYFISNEGNFTKSNASITFIDNDLMQETNGVFEKVNDKPLGDVFQSIAFDGDYAFLVVNNSNKIEVVNRYTFKSITTITENLKLPRYAVVENGKLFVTNSTDKSVLVYDATSFAFVTSIVIEKTVEEIKKDNGNLYIMNASYSSGNEITVINASNNTVIKTITVGDGLNSIEIEDGVLYALHSTGITKVNTSSNEVIGEISFEDGLSNASKLEVEDNYIYFISGSKIFKFNKDATSLANTEFVDTKAIGASWAFGYGFDVVDDKLFYTNANGFSENSEVTVYDLDGKLLKTFTAGMGANGAYDND